ncbi:MAG: hypothetical protein EHM85_19395 [Desulfobacteraceae bacterium]|nr:MAG: hypothetical protein EHM85_19395 [Desulfobacteraceae bacterium]
MFIFEAKTVHRMKTMAILCLTLVMGYRISSSSANACSCEWRGPFLTAAKETPLVVRGKIIRHHSGPTPTMVVLVLETLKGGLLDSGMVVQMGDGMHCRPALDCFPPGSEWILALNGPGSKPGRGHAISHCGEYWLRVENNDVVGSIDGAENQKNRMPFHEFKNKFLYPHFKEKFSGRITTGERYHHSFGSRFEFILEPSPAGWEVTIKEFGRDENLSRLTPSLHFAPNSREIEGWHLSDNPTSCVSRSYGAEAGPDNPRRLIFSPEVGVRIDGIQTGRSVTAEEIEDVRRFGRGILTIESFELEPKGDGCPKIVWMKFSVELEGGY